MDLFKKLGIIVTDDHFVYASGKHGSIYVNKDGLYPHIEETCSLCEEIASRFCNDNIEVVIAPALGGIILEFETAFYLSEMTGKKVLGIYAEKDDVGDYMIRRGYDALISGKRVLVVEDILTTGKTVAKVVEAVRKAGGEVVGVAALCNRGSVTHELVGNVPRLISLTEIDLESWEPQDCPLCKSGVPINTKLGKGKK